MLLCPFGDQPCSSVRETLGKDLEPPVLEDILRDGGFLFCLYLLLFSLCLEQLSLMSPLETNLCSYEFHHLPLYPSIYSPFLHIHSFFYSLPHPLTYPYIPSPIHLPTHYPPINLLIIHTPAYFLSTHSFIRSFLNAFLSIYLLIHLPNHPPISHISTNACSYSSKYPLALLSTYLPIYPLFILTYPLLHLPSAH